MFRAAVFALCVAGVWSMQAQSPASLKGVITDPSGALVPDALVQLRGNGPEQRAHTNGVGEYSFSTLRPGKYELRVIAKGFTVMQKKDFSVNGPLTFDVQLTIQADAQVVNVEDEANTGVSAEPDANGTALVLHEKELAALSDDPDELEQQLQALAGPGAGPNGGQIYIDGFTGGKLPAKASIREVRVNSNPFSPEYERPGFGRIEILTRPGSDKIRGSAFFNFNNQSLNSRSPLLASALPDYMSRFFGFNLSGPIKKQKASFGIDVERRAIDENAFILATTLDNSFNPTTLNQAIVTPQVRTHISPRLDYSINTNNTLVVRYQYSSSRHDNEGVGNYSLASKAYNQTDSENTLQITETSILSPKAINETRFQFMRTDLSQLGDNTLPAINVQGAFNGGGAQIGNSGNLSNHLELSNTTTYTHGTHAIKWGARLRQSFLDSTSANNFGGSYTFFGGTGPLLDAASLPIAGTSTDLSALERYRRTLLFQQMGLSPALIRLYGGGASQFSLNAGLPATSVNQFDAGLFLNDDWRLRRNFTLSYGVRYETQTNIGDHGNISPRIGIAWGIDGGANKTTKTVLRAGAGIFYDRIADSLTLQALRFNGVTQQAYLLTNPDFFPAIPTLDQLSGNQQPQQLQYLYSNIDAPRTYQASIGVDRQINQYARLSVQYITSRGAHLLRTRNINAPLNGVYPYGDKELRMLTESTGFSRTNQFVVSPNINYKKIFLFGFYSYGHGSSDAEGQPSDPYNLRADWGPSSFADVRHRVLIGTNIPLPVKFTLNPFFVASTGVPYNITTGRDTNGDGFTNERPALLDLGAAQCSGGSLVYASGFGCYDLNPAPGTAIGRNSARGPGSVTLNLRLARTFSFGKRAETADGAPSPGMRGPEGGFGGGRRGGPGGGPGMMGGGMRGGGGPGGFGGGNTGMKYNLMLSISARNVLNHANYGAPSGDLSSPFFGQYRSLAGGFGPFGAASTFNRRLDLQLRFTF